jgi:hypothetical protein
MALSTISRDILTPTSKYNILTEKNDRQYPSITVYYVRNTSLHTDVGLRQQFQNKHQIVPVGSRYPTSGNGARTPAHVLNINNLDIENMV